MSGRLKQWLLDPVLLIGAIISVVLPVILFTRGAEEEFSTIVGLLIFVVTLLVQLTLSEKARLERETLYGGIARTFESKSWLADDARRILTYMEGAEQRFRDSPVNVTCRAVFSRVAADLAQLSDGHMRLPAGDRSWAVEVTHVARRQIRALTVEPSQPSFWFSPLGWAYLDAQRLAIARGVEVQRVIVYTEWSEKLDEITRHQLDAGIQLFRVASHRLQPDLRVNLAVWDDVCGFETDVNADGEPVSHRFTIRDFEIRALAERIQVAWALRENIPMAVPYGT